ncbi:MAG: cytochrome c3 family protein [Myxococcales bacterium]|nr:cytochrome c3 family protein [Myxococcales bacterium]
MIAFFVVTEKAALAEPPSALDQCLGCHGDKSLERVDASKKKESVYIDRLGLSRSEHRGLVCTDCHSKEFSKDPHPPARRAICLDCHVGNSTLKDGVQFGDIIRDFQGSVHALKNEAFRCIHCHDAHTFQLDVTRQRIFEHNKVCLRCHASVTQFDKMVQKKPPDLDKAHEWLPNRDLHWRTVRCLECHTGYDPKSSHLVLAKKFAVKKCEACHSQNPAQLMRLYSRMRAAEVRELGFLNATIINRAYVIGATRNRRLDFFALLIIGGTFAGVSGHGALRILFGQLRKRRGKGGHG